MSYSGNKSKIKVQNAKPQRKNQKLKAIIQKDVRKYAEWRRKHVKRVEIVSNIQPNLKKQSQFARGVNWRNISNYNDL